MVNRPAAARTREESAERAADSPINLGVFPYAPGSYRACNCRAPSVHDAGCTFGVFPAVALRTLNTFP
jgi:hypothetical protein